jgi:hypothetical protein
MKKDILCLRPAFRLMLHNQNSGAWTDIVDFPSRWESTLVDLTGPEIPRNCQQMRVPQQRYEFAIHELIVTRATYWHPGEERV